MKKTRERRKSAKVLPGGEHEDLGAGFQEEGEEEGLAEGECAGFQEEGEGEDEGWAEGDDEAEDEAEDEADNPSNRRGPETESNGADEWEGSEQALSVAPSTRDFSARDEPGHLEGSRAAAFLQRHVHRVEDMRALQESVEAKLRLVMSHDPSKGDMPDVKELMKDLGNDLPQLEGDVYL